VPQVGAQHTVQVPAITDQNPVQALGSDGPHPPLGIRIGLRRRLHRMRTIGTDLSG
jgi:hypothetical protein